MSEQKSVPPELRAWSVPYPGYAPVEVTPRALLEGLAESVAEGWAEPYARPQDVPDWFERTGTATLPFRLDADGWPLNPTGRTGRAGRILGRWGENQAADPIVIAGPGANLRVLMIRRPDTGQWAIPGGLVDQGELAPAALVRDLREEMGIDLARQTPMVLDMLYVEDPRATDHAWVASTVVVYRLAVLEPVVGANVAFEARWVPLRGVDGMEKELAEVGGIYPAHKALLELALEGRCIYECADEYIEEQFGPSPLDDEHDPSTGAAPSAAGPLLDTVRAEQWDDRVEDRFPKAAAGTE